MAKKSDNLKLKRRESAEYIIKLVCIQIVIILCLVVAFASKFNLENATRTTDSVLVENTECRNILFGDYTFIVCSEDKEYRFPNDGNNRYLMKSIATGSIIQITYIDEFSIWGNFNKVIDARTETEVYLACEDYIERQEKSLVAVMVILALLEIIFLSALILYLISVTNNLKALRKHKK